MIRRTTDPFEGIPVKSNVELVLRHYEDLVNGGDLSAADRDLSPEFIDHAAPLTPHRGLRPPKHSSPCFVKRFRTSMYHTTMSSTRETSSRYKPGGRGPI